MRVVDQHAVKQVHVQANKSLRNLPDKWQQFVNIGKFKIGELRAPLTLC